MDACSKQTAWVVQAICTVVGLVRVLKLSSIFSASAVPRASTSTWSGTIVLCQRSIMTSDDTMALKWCLDGGNLKFCPFVKTITQTSSGTSTSPRMEILWPVVQTSSSRTRWTGTSILLRWWLPGILARRKEEPRSSPTMGNFAQTWGDCSVSQIEGMQRSVLCSAVWVHKTRARVFKEDDFYLCQLSWAHVMKLSLLPYIHPNQLANTIASLLHV